MANNRSIAGEVSRMIQKGTSTFYSNKIIDRKISSLVTDEIQLINFWSGSPSTIKLSVGLVRDITNTFDEPGISLGQGDGAGGNRGYITKDTNSLNFYYVGNLALGEVAGLAIYKDRIESTHKLVVNAGLGSEFIIDATNWTNKLTKAQIEDGANGYAIPKANLISAVRTTLDHADTIYGTYFGNNGKLVSAYVADAAMTASKLNVEQLMVTGAIWTDNDPSSGFIKWATADTIKVILNGTATTITPASTNYKYVYWTVGSSTFSGSNTKPVESSTVYMIAINNAGVHSKAYYSRLAQKYISSAYIDDLAVESAHIVSLDAAKINAGLLQGFTIQTAASPNTRVVSNVDGITFYDEYNRKRVMLPNTSAGGEIEFWLDTTKRFTVGESGGDFHIRPTAGTSGTNYSTIYIGNSGFANTTTLFYGNVDVSNATMVGTKKIHVGTSAPADLSGGTIWIDIN